MEDSEIVELYWQRSENAITESQRKYGAYCRSVALHILQDLSDAEECENDTYIRAWNSMPPNRPQLLRTYLGRLARSCAISRQREKYAQKRGGGEIPLALDELAECVGTSDDDNGTENETIRQVVDGFLDALPSRTRIMFVQRYWYLCPVKEIARDLGISDGAVKMALSRARESLHRELEKEGIIL